TPSSSISSMNYLSKSTPIHTERGFNSVLFGNDDLPTARFSALSINTATALPSPSLPSPSLHSPGFRPPNAGDQNPPCNTLYVGNLPMNTNEEELRQLFSRCVGYKRMCFRTKANGPMCFVEFENVECATQALTELYGNPLSNSVKGGIRLSYSKNPLGVRSNNNNNNSNNNNNNNVNAQHNMSSLGSQLHAMKNMNNMNNMGGLSHGLNGVSYIDRRDSMASMYEPHY